MKKLFCFALPLCFVGLFMLAGCGAAPEPPIAGGYTEDRAVTAEDMAVFEEALDGFVGVGYVPALVATQVVAGTNYRFTAEALGVYPGAEPYQAYVFIFKPLEGPAELVKVETLTAEETTEPEPIAGGWSENREIAEEEIAIFNEAMAGQVGLYIPNFVATQVVAGTNYRFTAAMHVDASGNNLPFAEDVHIFIFKPLQGPAELVEIV